MGLSKWENIGDLIDMSKSKAQADIKVGKTLTFSQEGSLHHYKVRRLPGNGSVWVERVTLLSEANKKKHEGHAVDTTQTPWFCENCQSPVDNN